MLTWQKMNHAVGQVKEERLLRVSLYKVQGILRVTLRQIILISRFQFFDHGLALNEGQRRKEGFGIALIIGEGDTEILVEALMGWEKGWLITKVPFADTCGRVAPLLKDFGDCDFIRIKALAVARPEHAVVGRVHLQVVVEHVNARRVTTCQQRSPRRRANARRNVKARKGAAFPGHSKKVRRAVTITERLNVGIPEVINEDDNEVREIRPAVSVSCKGG